MQSAIQLFWSGWHVGWDPNKSLTPTNLVHCIGNMYNIINISIILYIHQYYVLNTYKYVFINKYFTHHHKTSVG